MARRLDQTNTKTNQQSYHSFSFPSNGKRFPLTLKTEQGANLQRQQTGRGPRRCGLGSARCEPHSDLHTGKRHQASAPQCAEQGGNERPDRIPPWAGDHMALEARGTWSGSWAFSDCLS
ncbi:hypothetical protein ABVT39_025988 [Epinephelus coioides]